MTVTVMSSAIHGISASRIDIEVDITNGLPATIMVGLPGTAVQESRERVKSALKNSGLSYPYTRVAVNLAPAHVPKAGSHYDVAIAIAIALASGQCSAAVDNKMFIGELSLNGEIRSVSGVLAMAKAALAAGCDELYVPCGNVQEALLIQKLRVYGVSSLLELIYHLAATKLIEPALRRDIRVLLKTGGIEVDMSEIHGQSGAKRALEIALSGGHNILFHGPPGSGKTLLARAAAGILPPLTQEECVDLTTIYSISGLCGDGVVTNRPVRQPHHSASLRAMVGGGANPRPGEITLAHRGILFLDELLEFDTAVLECLRQPLEDQKITIVRHGHSVVFPADFLLIAACNPCPCGFYGDSSNVCMCPMAKIQAYQKRLSGPLLDRIDIHAAMPRITFDELRDAHSMEYSDTVRARVVAARNIQHKRFNAPITNSKISRQQMERYCALDRTVESFLKAAAEQYNFSARSINKILKIARTIADMDSSEEIELAHITEAVQYRARSEIVI